MGDYRTVYEVFDDRLLVQGTADEHLPQLDTRGAAHSAIMGAAANAAANVRSAQEGAKP